MFLEALVSADRAENELRCYFIMHHHGIAGVSDLEEYESLKEQAERAAGERHRCYRAAVEHRKQHNV
jgi:hypothetical protein